MASSESKAFAPKNPVKLDPPKDDPISIEDLSKCDGKAPQLQPVHPSCLPVTNPWANPATRQQLHLPHIRRHQRHRLRRKRQLRLRAQGLLPRYVGCARASSSTLVVRKTFPTQLHSTSNKPQSAISQIIPIAFLCLVQATIENPLFSPSIPSSLRRPRRLPRPRPIKPETRRLPTRVGGSGRQGEESAGRLVYVLQQAVQHCGEGFGISGA